MTHPRRGSGAAAVPRRPGRGRAPSLHDAFPIWAPSEAVAWYRGAVPHLDDAPSSNAISDSEYARYGTLPKLDKMHMTRDLLTQPAMQAVWNSLSRRRVDWAELARASRRQRSFLHPSLDLINECETWYAYWYAVPKISRAEAKQQLRAMADAARELALTMDELPQVSSMDVAELAAPDEINGIADWLGLADRGEPARGTRRDWHLRRIDYPRKDTSPPGEIRFALSSELPCVPDLLRRLADRLRDVETRGAGLTQPNAKSAQLHFVARQLALYFREAYGSPLYNNVAAIVGVIFREDVDPNAIRDLMKPR